MILSIGTSAALVATSLPGNGASVDFAIDSGMPCFHAGGGAGAAAGAAVCAWADILNAKAKPRPLIVRK